jgi:hypothetical protein
MRDSKITLDMQGSDTPPASPPYTDGVKLLRQFEQLLPEGVASNQLNVEYLTEASIAALGTLTINFGAAGDTDPYGVAVNATDWVVLFVEAVDDGAGGTLQVEGTAANPVDWFNATAVMKLPTATFVMLWNFTAGRVPVTALLKQLLLRNTHAGSAVTARVIGAFRR